MKCPMCKEVDLLMTERQGTEIDYCPTCRGVWLDRGKLDKIIERSVRPAMDAPMTASVLRDDHYSDHHDKHGEHGYRKRRSWLGGIFD
jgi:uncharacterized protein